MFDTKNSSRWSKIKVGLVLTVGLFILLLLSIFRGEHSEYFLKKQNKNKFTDVIGLRKGAPVWISGSRKDR